MNAPLASVIIPAHNEESVLDRCLQVLLAGFDSHELDVVVVANACTDRTVEIARGADVRVVETSTPGKANALRVGDAESVTFPRIYADADIELGSSSARALISALNGSAALAAAPVPIWDLAGASGPARRVHRVHEQLIARRRGLAGVGVYVLTERGHGRIFPLPDVLSDDGFVHRSFAARERLVVAGAPVVVRPARTLRAHLRRRIRVRQGNRQLDALGVPAPDGRIRVGSLVRLVAERSVSALDAALYLGVLAVDVVITRCMGQSTAWSADATSRQALISLEGPQV